MRSTVICDASPLILFSKIGELDILQKIYGHLVTTPEIASEYGEPLPQWISIREVADKKYQKFLQTQIDSGEASAIALATEIEDVLLLLDDLKARKLAVELEFKVTGSLGVIHRAKQVGIIDKIKPLVLKILETDFRISEAVIKELLLLNNE